MTRRRRLLEHAPHAPVTPEELEACDMSTPTASTCFREQGGYVCTRQKGHVGPHVAAASSVGGDGGRVYHQWETR
jgi:hypothetical protein